MPIFFCLVLIILVGDYLIINAGSLQIKLGWSWATITSTLHIEVSSLGCKLSIFFFFSKKKRINSYCLVHGSTWNQKRWNTQTLIRRIQDSKLGTTIKIKTINL